MQKISKALLLFITLLLVSLVALSPSSLAATGTQVGGIINVDTTWTQTSNPYCLTSTVVVGCGSTLTIEPGTTIDLNGYNLQINGILFAKGNNTNNILISSSVIGGLISFTASSSSWNEKNQTGCIIDCAVLNDVYIQVHTTAPRISNNTIYPSHVVNDQIAVSMESGAPIIMGNYINGSIECLDGASPTIVNNVIHGGITGQGFCMASPLIVNNTISGGSPQMSAGTGIYADGGGYFIANNSITGCLTGINVAEGNNIIEGNLIINNINGIMFTGEEDTTAILRHNTICNNSIGLVNYYYSSAEAMTINMFYNNIVSNQQYNVRWLNLTNNWWGTTNQTAIGLVIGNTTTYIPILTAPDALAPPIPETLNTIILPTVSPSPTPTSSPNPTAFSTTSATTSSSIQNNVTEKPTEIQPEKAIPELTPLVVLLLLGVTLLATTLMVTKQRIAQSKK